MKHERLYSDAPLVNFDSATEMSAYLDEPAGMYVGCPGKRGYVQLCFAVDSNGNGRSVLRELNRRAPLIVQQALYFDEELPQMPCVYVLSSGGPNVEGDRYMVDIRVEHDAMAHVSTGAATKLAEMRRNYSGQVQNIWLEEGAYLEYLPEPIIPCRHSRYICRTRLVVHPSATIVYAETLVGGRKYFGNGELFEFDVLSMTTCGERPNGEQLFREKFVIEPKQCNVRNEGIMHGYDVLANIVVMTPREKAKTIYDATKPFINAKRKLAVGITRLPNDAGLLFKVLGEEVWMVKHVAREFCSQVRMAVKKHRLPNEFPWRM